MGILIIHADHETTASEWQRITELVSSVAPGQTVQVESATSGTTAEYADEIRDAVNNHGQVDERLHDPLGEYDDATWQSFSPQKRGSIKRHRNGNDAPFVQAAQSQPVAAPVSDAMAELFAAAGLAPTEPTSVPAPEPTPQPAAQPVRNKADKASDLTVDQRSTLAIWANKDMRPAGQEDKGLADPKKIALANAFLQGKVTLTQLAAYETKGGKSNLAKDIARVVKCDLVNA